MNITEAIRAVPHTTMTLQTALSKLTYVYRAYNMRSDGLSHYKLRFCKLCYSYCGDGEWQADLYCWIYNDALSSMRIIVYCKIITKIMS